MNTIKEKLEELYDILIQISPMENITEDPFSSNTKYSAEIVTILSTLISKAGEEKEKISKENEQLYSEMKVYCKQLEIDVPAELELGNHILRNEYIKNELEKISIIRNTIKHQIMGLNKEIEELKEEMDDEDVDPITEELSNRNNNEISVENLEMLKKLKKLFLNKMSCLESKRQQFYDEIISYNSKLSKMVDFSYDEKIGDLKKMLTATKNEYEAKKKQFDFLINDIKKRETILNIQHQNFETDFNNKQLNEMAEYNKYLENEQKRLFDEIFERTQGQIVELCNIFGKTPQKYPKIEESLVEMRNELNRLLSMKGVYIELTDKIEKRRELLAKMTEFEKIASDPKRLFKSSFQLNSEEKFRNNAYPSLLKMEESLYEMIEKFEQSFEPFIFENKEFKTALKNEIDNRIINRTVFISRCDSPFRKKK